jgi:hypothetical protein
MWMSARRGGVLLPVRVNPAATIKQKTSSRYCWHGAPLPRGFCRRTLDSVMQRPHSVFVARCSRFQTDFCDFCVDNEISPYHGVAGVEARPCVGFKSMSSAHSAGCGHGRVHDPLDPTTCLPGALPLTDTTTVHHTTTLKACYLNLALCHLKLANMAGTAPTNKKQFGSFAVGAACRALELDPQSVRCAFFGRNLHSRMPLVPTPARFKRAGV